jgi:indolepyruvate ferredoxin oxidoreductase beta subunit
MTTVHNILLVGVGGQGTILVSKVLSQALMAAGYDVKMSEVHGMSQRGGSVSTQVRFGERVYSPIMAEGTADILVSFETMEALRWLDFLKPGGRVVVNDYEIPSAPILAGRLHYPTQALAIVRKRAHAVVIRAAEIAERVGNARTMNIVLLGALIAEMTELSALDWPAALAACVKPALLEVNLVALEAGRQAAATAVA